MDNYENQDNMQQQANVQRYRQRRVDEFKLNINSGDGAKENISSKKSETPSSSKKAFSDEITSFSDENTRAQIERDSKKELRRQKKEEKKILKIKSGRNKKVYRFAWLILLVISSIVVGQFLITGCNDFLAMNRKETDTVLVKVTKEDGIGDIAEKLEDAGVIDSSTFFTLFTVLTNQSDDIEPGIYTLSKNKDYLGILNYLQYTGNRLTTITLQITEGTNIIDLADQLYDAGVTYDKEEFLRLCNSDEFDADYPFLSEIEPHEDRVYKLEGYMFPDTYEFYVEEAPDVTIRRFLSNFQSKIYESEYEVEGYDQPVKLIELISDSDFTLDEVVTLASLVQGEAADVEDMYNVSSVINNRLFYGAQSDIHSLGLDCTAFYPYKNAESVPEDIKDTFHSKYETYDTRGLPPGAICSGSAHAFLAAVAPNDTDYLYFCHGVNDDGTVTAYYAVTFNEHMANIEKAGLE